MMPASKKILIAANNPDFGRMLEAYVQYYSNGNCETWLTERKNDTHPLVLQVMKEDGIELRIDTEKHAYVLKPQLQPDIVVTINSDNSNIVKQHGDITKYALHVDEPFEYTRYDDIVQSLRNVREEIKRAGIEMVGSLITAS